MNKIYWLLLILPWLLPACTGEQESAHYESPLVRTQQYQDLKFSTQVKEVRDDQLLLEFRVSPTEADGRDVVMHQVKGIEDYQHRMNTLNFHMEESLELRLSEAAIPPVLVHMENTYGLTNYRIFQVIFGGNEVKQALAEDAELDLVFIDPVFDTGISHFVFQRRDLDPARVTLTDQSYSK